MIWVNAVYAGIVIGIGIVVIVLVFNTLAQSNLPEQSKEIGENLYETGKDIAPELLKAGILYCDVKNISIDDILISGIHDQMLLNAKNQTKEILNNWIITEKVTACEVAILDYILLKEGTEKVWRSQIGIGKAMKNIQGYTLIACTDEYKIIEYLEDDV